MNHDDAIFDALIDKVVKELEEPGTGYVYLKDVITEVERRLTTEGLPLHVQSQLVRRTSRYEAGRYFNRRKPKFTTQAPLYNPEYWLPLGKGKRVRMSAAGSTDLATFLRGIISNRVAVDTGCDIAEIYVSERVEALDSNPGQRLDWIERHLFDYADESPTLEEVPEDD